MDNHQWHHHHHYHHHNQSYPNQGNNLTICPTCSISHFPFCPPRASHVPPPPLDPYIDPPRNPSMTHMDSFSNFGRTDRERYDPRFGDECNYLSDGSSKRLRVDGVDESRFRLVRDHGSEVIYELSQCRDVGSYGKRDSFGFDGNVDAREKDGVSSVGYSAYRDEMGFQSSYGSYGGVKRSVFDGQDGLSGNRIGNVGHEFGNRYGEMVKPVDSVGLRQDGVVGYEKDGLYQGYQRMDCRSSYGMNESSYGYRDLNNGPMQYEQRNNVAMLSHYSSSQAASVNTMQQHGQMRYDYHSASPSQFNERRYLLDAGSRPVEGYQGSFGNQHVPMQSNYGPPHGNNHDGYGNSLDAEPRPVEGYQSSFGNQHVPMHSKYGPPHGDNHGGYGNSYPDNMGHFRASQGVDVQPPLPPLPASPPPPPPPPLPMEPPPPVSSLFPVAASSSSAVQSSYAPIPEFHMPPQPHLPSAQVLDSSRGMMQRDLQPPLSSSGHYVREGSGLPSKNSFKDKPKVLDASELFKLPHRATRPDHFVIILRGLPGSGKSYLAKMLRDLEVEHGGNAPRIHSMDDYFMTEVEKAEENETSKSSGRGKKPIMKKVLEYCYEPEMEEAYRASMLKAFKKTLDEGAFTFVIVDDRNLRVADFAQFWATAKRSGYEVYVLEAPYKDPAGCAARNVHGFGHDDVEKMAAQWEEAPSLYLQLDVKSLFHGDDLAESNIQEVDMDTDDGDFEGSLPGTEESEPGKFFAPSGGDVGPHGERSWDADGDNPAEVNDLGRSKWSSNLDDDDDERTEVLKGKPNVLSGLLKTYGKEGKSVHWGDQGGRTGFSIGAVKKANAASLVIGPGAGYNMKSNPMHEDDVPTSAKSGEMRKHSVFKERLRAEQESFKAVFDRRRQRIGGVEEE